MTPVHATDAAAQGFEISNFQLEHSLEEAGGCAFFVRILEFTFGVGEGLSLPEGKAGNTLRGALGSVWPRIEAEAGGPSGLRNPPGPFVFRAAHLDGATIAAGETFGFRMHVFDPGVEERLCKAFGRLERLGADRRRVEMVGVTRRDVTVELFGHAPVETMRVRFVTPTELKGGTVPTFGLLAARVRDRVSTLRALYGAGALPIDFQAFGRFAKQSRLVRNDTHLVEVLRRSSRTGQRHSLGGFVGEAEYSGELGPFVGLFRAAAYTGVGRHTAFGNGEIAIDT